MQLETIENSKHFEFDPAKFHVVFADPRYINFEDIGKFYEDYWPNNCPIIFVACKSPVESFKHLSFDSIKALENFVQELKQENIKWMHRKHHPRISLEFFFSSDFFRISKKGQLMLVSLTPGQVATAVISPTALGKPSNATLTEVSFSVADPTVVTIVNDPATPNGCIITGVGSGTATSTSITANALATEPDGVTTEQVTGTDSVDCSPLPPKPPVADALVFTLTSPTIPIPPPIPVVK